MLSRDGKIDKARDELEAMENTIDKSLKELRRVVIALRPPALEELGLNHAVRQSLEELKAEGVECHFSRTGDSLRLPLDIEIAVYRVVQEAINNIRKHSEATEASLTLNYQRDRLQVDVRDNGKGFDLSRTLDSAIAGGHMGLLGMKERAEALGGDLRIRTSPERGTLLTLRFPIRSAVQK
jgi:two-component system sensor histidine kinase DegS